MESLEYRDFFALSQKHQIIVVANKEADVDRFHHSAFKHLNHIVEYNKSGLSFNQKYDSQHVFYLIMDNSISAEGLPDYSFVYFSSLDNSSLMIDELEVTNYCNLRCKYCCQQEININKGFISRETLNQCMPYFVEGQNLCIHGHGEPLLHERLLDIINLLSNNNINVEMSTNGVLLTIELAMQLIAAGLKYLIISLHNEKSYLAFEKLLKLQNETSLGILQYHVNAFESIEVTKQKLKKYGISPEIAWPNIRFQREITWGGKAKNGLLSTEKNVKEVLDRCYYRINNFVYVKWNGVVVPCCLDSNNEDSIGHISNFEKIRFDNLSKKNCMYCDF